MRASRSRHSACARRPSSRPLRSSQQASTRLTVGPVNAASTPAASVADSSWTPLPAPYSFPSVQLRMACTDASRPSGSHSASARYRMYPHSPSPSSATSTYLSGGVRVVVQSIHTVPGGAAAQCRYIGDVQRSPSFASRCVGCPRSYCFRPAVLDSRSRFCAWLFHGRARSTAMAVAISEPHAAAWKVRAARRRAPVSATRPRCAAQSAVVVVGPLPAAAASRPRRVRRHGAYSPPVRAVSRLRLPRAARR